MFCTAAEEAPEGKLEVHLAGSLKSQVSPATHGPGDESVPLSCGQETAGARAEHAREEWQVPDLVHQIVAQESESAEPEQTAW